MYSLLFCVHSLNTKPVYSGFMTLCVWLSDKPNRFFEKVHVDTFLNINAVWLQLFVSPETPKALLSYIPKKDFRKKLWCDPPMISVINHEKQRGRSYQGLWWHLQIYWRMGSIPGKKLLVKNFSWNCHIPRSTWSPWASSLDHIKLYVIKQWIIFPLLVPDHLGLLWIRDSWPIVLGGFLWRSALGAPQSQN